MFRPYRKIGGVYRATQGIGRLGTGGRRIPRLNPGDPINRALVAWWPLDGNTFFNGDTQQYDVSGHANHGTLTGAVTFGVDGIGKGATTAGANGTYITTPYTFPSTDFSISLWARSASGYGANNRVFGNSDYATGASGLGFIWGLTNPSKMFIVARGGAGSGDLEYDLPSMDPTGDHFCITLSSVDGLRGYWNGDQRGITAGRTSIGNSFTTRINADANQTTGGSFTGTSDDIRVWERVLEPTEVRRLAMDRTGTVGALSPAWFPIGGGGGPAIPGTSSAMFLAF